MLNLTRWKIILWTTWGAFPYSNTNIWYHSLDLNKFLCCEYEFELGLKIYSLHNITKNYMEAKICTRCKNTKTIDCFMSDAGKELKICVRCRGIMRAFVERKRCIHNRVRSQCVCVCMCMYVYVCTHMYVRIVCHVFVCVWMYVNVCIYVCMYVDVYVYSMYVYVCIALEFAPLSTSK